MHRRVRFPCRCVKQVRERVGLADRPERRGVRELIWWLDVAAWVQCPVIPVLLWLVQNTGVRFYPSELSRERMYSQMKPKDDVNPVPQMMTPAGNTSPLLSTKPFPSAEIAAGPTPPIAVILSFETSTWKESSRVADDRPPFTSGPLTCELI